MYKSTYQKNQLCRLFQKYLFLMFLFSFSVISLNANQTSISQATQTLWDYLSPQLDSLNTRYIYIDVVRSSDAELINYHLTDYALKAGFKVSETKNDSVTTISVLSDNKTIVKRQNYVLFTKEDAYIYPQYLIKISQENTVVLSKTLSLNENLLRKTKMITRWYEPVMLSAVIGSLVYLIYYGNH